MLLHCGFGDESWAPVVRGNTFLQYYDGELGRFGVAPTGLMRFDCRTPESLAGNEFYAVRDDG